MITTREFTIFVALLSTVPAVTTYGSSLDFDGDDDRVVVQADLLNTVPATLELWFLIEGMPDQDYTLICNDLSGHWGHGILINPEGRLGVQRHDTWEWSEPVVELGKWQHAAVVFEEGAYHLYLDGNEVLANSYTQLTPDSREYFWIGGNPDDENGDLRRYTNGLIDEVRVWNIDRTPEEIDFWRHRTVSPGTPGLAGYWRFEEGEGQVVSDASPSGHHGYLGSDPVTGDANDPLWNSDNAPIISDIPTVSEWGMFAMTLLILSAGALVLMRRRATQA